MKYVGYILLAVVAFIGIHYIATGTFILTAPSRVISKTMETDNIVHRYEQFFDLKAAYDRTLPLIKGSQDMLSKESDTNEKFRLRTELRAQQDTCRSIVTKYNVNAQKLNVGLFKDWRLPEQLTLETCTLGA